MIKSMTGFASAAAENEWASASVTIKAVNHRFLDLQLRAPQALAPAEAGLRALVQQRVGRGRLEVTIALQARRPTTASVELDETFAARLAGAVARARELGLVTGALQAGDLLRFPQALSVRDDLAAPPDEEVTGLRRVAEAGLTAALDALDGMRRQEGAMLQVDVDRRRAVLAEAIDRVEAAAAEAQGAVRVRLHDRIQELGAELALEPSAVAQEVVRFVARSDIAEEVVRFRAHLEHMRGLLAAPEPCGRKLDFLIQEMNREVNTIGSKADGLQVPVIIVDMKSELERLREQVQNIE